MQDETNIEILNSKVTMVLQNYTIMKQENDDMRMQIISLKAEKELKDGELEKLREDSVLKDMEIEEIIEKFEKMLG